MGVGDIVEDGDGEGVGVTEGFGVATFTPLLQTNFLPDLMQVYV